MKIIATISKHSHSADMIEEIIRAGAEVLRYNFSYGTPSELEHKIRTARFVIDKLGLRRKVKILADLPGAKIRMGEIPSEKMVQAGECVTFKSISVIQDGEDVIPVDFPMIGRIVVIGQTITLADGEVGFFVEEIYDEHSFRARACNSYAILSRKGINFGSMIDELDHLTVQTREHIEKLRVISPEWVAFSFVNSAANLKKAKHLLIQSLGYCPTIVSKIESQKGVENIHEIAQASDVLLVARGDLGLNCPIEMLGVYQKKIVAAAKQAGKQVIISTQILDSLLRYHIPCRSDVLDLTNAVLDGADAIMLTKETGMSKTPGISIVVARRIIDAVAASM